MTESDIFLPEVWVCHPVRVRCGNGKMRVLRFLREPGVVVGNDVYVKSQLTGGPLRIPEASGVKVLPRKRGFLYAIDRIKISIKVVQGAKL